MLVENKLPLTDCAWMCGALRVPKRAYVCVFMCVWLASVTAVIWAADTEAPCRPMGEQGRQKGEGRVSEADSICDEGTGERCSDQGCSWVREGNKKRGDINEEKLQPLWTDLYVLLQPAVTGRSGATRAAVCAHGEGQRSDAQPSDISELRRERDGFLRTDSTISGQLEF